MVKKEKFKSLSEKEDNLEAGDGWYNRKDIKEFIKIIKEEGDTYTHEGTCKICKEDSMVDMNSECQKCKIDKRAGPKLITK